MNVSMPASQQNMALTFAILLPLTSRGSLPTDDVSENLKDFARSLAETTRSSSEIMRCIVYVGLDDDDISIRRIKKRIKWVLNEVPIVQQVRVQYFNHPQGAVCHLWRDLARTAYKDACDFYVLFGDDVVLHTPGWMPEVVDVYTQISINRKVPFGFGCVCFTDRTFPGFPTFPVMHRTHMEIFHGEMFPTCFINQHADPFLFQLYRNWGAAVISTSMHLSNKVGGAGPARYAKEHPAIEWTHRPLKRARNRIEEYLKRSCKTDDSDAPLRVLTIDVVTPSFRFPLEILQRFFDLPVSETCSVMFIVIVDSPHLSKEAMDFVKHHEANPFICFRFNDMNMGASFSRNRGIEESAADYILFLDDDVVVEKHILIEYEKAVRAHPGAAGVVGRTTFPAPQTIFQNAVHLACVTYFWTIADFMDTDIPWGVTANLLVRREDDSIRFDLRFPKTGGGEDIDFCLRKANWCAENTDNGEGFVSGKRCRAIHPWWNGGSRRYRRFYMWAVGDGLLAGMYPELTFKDWAPNTPEILLIIAVVCLASACLDPGNSLGYAYAGVRALALNAAVQIGFEFWRHGLTNCDIGGYTITVRSWRWILAVAESAMIRILSETGRTVGLLSKGYWNTLGTRFDWFAGKVGNGPRRAERRACGVKFVVWVVAVICFLHNWEIMHPAGKLQL